MSHWASCCLIRKAVPRTKPTNRKLIPTVLYAIERAVTHTSRALLDHSSQSSEVSSRFSKSSTTSSGASSRSFQSSHFKTREIRTKLTMIAMIMTMEAPKRRRWIFLPFWRLFPQHSHDHIPVAVTIMEPYVRPRTTPPQSPPTVERRAPIRARMPMTMDVMLMQLTAHDCCGGRESWTIIGICCIGTGSAVGMAAACVGVG
mmetsp:Transcript_21284/g.50479  ORF Transcript_21284/g.50479 Transcript_21284/m.50479 type:complete len:202 (+) Transcript_21284:212-817(+)